MLIPPSIIMVFMLCSWKGCLWGKMLMRRRLSARVSSRSFIFCLGIWIRVRLNPKLAPPRPIERVTWKQQDHSLKGLWGIIVLFGVLAAESIRAFSRQPEVRACRP